MSSHNRHHASAASRSRISALSQSLGFTSISSHPPNASTPRNLSPVQSRSNSPGPTQTHQQLSASLPSLPMQPPPFPAPSLSASIPNSSDMNDPPSPRSRSRSNASISSQMFPNVAASGPPPNAPAAIFAAGPGAYYAYPFFPPPPPSHVPSHTTAPSVGVNSGHHDAPGIGVGMGGLRTSYSSPHLPYLFDAGGLAAFHHHQQQQQQQERERQQRQQELEHQVSVAQAQQNLQNSSVELNDDDVTSLQPPPYGHHETTFSIGQPQVSTTSADSAPVQFPTPRRGTRAHSRSHGHLTLQTTSASVPLLSSSGPPSPSYYRSSGNPDSMNGTNNTNARSRRPARNAGSFSQQQPQHHQSDHPNRYDYLGADEGQNNGRNEGWEVKGRRGQQRGFGQEDSSSSDAWQSQIALSNRVKGARGGRWRTGWKDRDKERDRERARRRVDYSDYEELDEMDRTVFVDEIDAALRRSRKRRAVRMAETDESSHDPTMRWQTSRRRTFSSSSTTSFSPRSSPVSLFRNRRPDWARVFPPIIIFFRLLSIVPASLAIISHVWNIAVLDPDTCRPGLCRVDYFLCLLWAMLTAHQCRKFTKGLFLRWKAYYPLLPTLIRLLGLQAICWPATHFTLVVLDHHVRPLICWTVIGTTTCVSRGIQIWATSNLSERRQRRRQKWGHMNGGVGENGSDGAEDDRATKEEEEREREEEKGRTRDWLRAWTRGIGSVGVGVGVEVMGPGKRWWDWKEIGLKCAVPAAVMYFVMAWGLLLSREFRSEGGGA